MKQNKNIVYFENMAVLNKLDSYSDYAVLTILS